MVLIGRNCLGIQLSVTVRFLSYTQQPCIYVVLLKGLKFKSTNRFLSLRAAYRELDALTVETTF